MTFIEDLEEHYLRIASPGYNPKFSSLREALSSAYEELDATYLKNFVDAGGDEEDWEPLDVEFDTPDIAQKLKGRWQLDDSAVQLELEPRYGND